MTMNRFSISFGLLLVLVTLIGTWRVFGQGSLTPPGAPAATMKTLQQVEPRTPITNLPVSILAPGSYYLVTNLTGVAGQPGITVGADGVTLDLMGFELVGVPGATFGVGSSGSVRNFTVRNGTVRGWGSGGVNLFSGEHFLIERVNAIQNTGIGLGVNSGSVTDCRAVSNTLHGIANTGFGLVRGCVAVDNGGDGISSVGPIRECEAQNNGARGILSGSSVQDSNASYNSGDGIGVEFGGLVRGCTSRFNTKCGITADQGSQIRDCAVYNNSTGIVANAKCAVLDCTLFTNNGPGISAGIGSTVKGNTVRQNSGDGITVPNDCLVSENHCTQNGGAGIRVTSAGNRIEANSSVLNAQGILLPPSTANLVIRNSARYNPGSGSVGSSNYVGTAGNDVGPIGTAAASTSPWANISY